MDGAHVDAILVGDSASNVMAGHETTLPITLDQMIYHATSVVRAAKGPSLWSIFLLAVIKVIPRRLCAPPYES